MSQQAQFTPWQARSENISLFQLQHNQPGANQSNPRETANIKKKFSIRKVDKYTKVLPKVYEKTHEYAHLNRKTEAGLEIMLKAINKNDLIIRIPENLLQLPKVQIQHPIKHSTKTLIRNPQAVQDKLGAKNQANIQKNKQIIGRWSELGGRIKKISEDMVHHESFANTLKKLNKYEQKIVKKCSLKNLKVYDESCDQKLQQTLQMKQGKTSERVGTKKEKKHILDRILSRLQ